MHRRRRRSTAVAGGLGILRDNRPSLLLLRFVGRIVNARGTCRCLLTPLALSASIPLRFRLLFLQCLALTLGVSVAVFSHTGASNWLQKDKMAKASPRPAILKEYKLPQPEHLARQLGPKE